MIPGKKAQHSMCILSPNKEHKECRAIGLLAIKLGYLWNQSKKEIHKKLQQHKLALVSDQDTMLTTVDQNQLLIKSAGKRDQIHSAKFGKRNWFLYWKHLLN